MILNEKIKYLLLQKKINDVNVFMKNNQKQMR